MKKEEVKHLANGTHAIFCREIDPDYDYQRDRELTIIRLLATLIMHHTKVVL